MPIGINRHYFKNRKYRHDTYTTANPSFLILVTVFM